MPPEEVTVCGRCRFWARMTEQLPPGQVPLVGRPKPGECRFWPPELIVLAQPHGPSVTCRYKPMNDDFPACAQGELREEEDA